MGQLGLGARLNWMWRSVISAMKHWFVVLLCLALIAFLVVESAPARAGGAMKKGRGGSKGGSRGSGKSNHPKGGGDDSGIGGHGVKTERPPCVGICHYNRIFNRHSGAEAKGSLRGSLL